MQIAWNLRLQAFAPSNHLYLTFLLTASPQSLYQAPPGAQQLDLPDFANVPHFAHAFGRAIVDEMLAVLTRRRAISSRSGTVAANAVGSVHSVGDIDPVEPSNMRVFTASEWTHALVHNFCVNDGAL